MASQIGYYDTLKSVAGKVFSFLASITLTGTDGKTITVTQDTSLDEAVAMSSKAPKTDTIKGDGTAGRVLRISHIIIDNGTTGVGLKCTTTSVWNGDANSEQDNIAKGATTGVWTLSANGTSLTLLNTGLQGDCVAVLGYFFVDQRCGTDITFVALASSGLFLICRQALGGVGLDLTTLVDTGVIAFYVVYLTSA